MSGTPEQRADLESRAKADVDSSGFKIDFSSTESIRGWCESAALNLGENNDAQREARATYMEAMQQPGATPGQIVAATNKFVTDYEGGDKSLEKSGLVEKLRSVVDGTAAHYNLDPRTGDPSTTFTDAKTAVASKFGSYTPHEPAVPAAAAAAAGSGAPVKDAQMESFSPASREAFRQMQAVYQPKTPK